MIMRIAERGSLRQYVERKKFLKEKTMKFWFRQIVSALDHLHNELSIAHRDLKLDNILISANFNVKLVDFGLSKQARYYNELSKTFCGSVAFIAPEKIAHNSHNIFKADIFSLGVVLFSCLNGKLPYDSKDKTQVLFSVTAQIFNFRDDANLSQDCLDVIYACMKLESSDRPTTDDLLRVDWLEKK